MLQFLQDITVNQKLTQCTFSTKQTSSWPSRQFWEKWKKQKKIQMIINIPLVQVDWFSAVFLFPTSLLFPGEALIQTPVPFYSFSVHWDCRFWISFFLYLSGWFLVLLHILIKYIPVFYKCWFSKCEAFWDFKDKLLTWKIGVYEYAHASKLLIPISYKGWNINWGFMYQTLC